MPFGRSNDLYGVLDPLSGPMPDAEGIRRSVQGPSDSMPPFGKKAAWADLFLGAAFENRNDRVEREADGSESGQHARRDEEFAFR